MIHLIDKAIQKARNSPSKFKISVIGFNAKGEVVGQAFNSLRFNHQGGGIHAEMALLKRYGNHIKTVLLCRVGNSGDILPIDPCPSCKRVLDKKRIKVIKVVPS